ncbi:uncharacterized protein LOC141703653 [Apium graveolens]|uniref:uncharacterized protein LOC141703653 n=1 Tax=Apium graveolens TaxID=4045 RepID=UPI003D7B0BF0
MSATAGSSTATLLDVNHPYYLHPSDNPGMILTTVILDENKYNQWHRSIEIYLSSKLKLGFVDGTYAQPASNIPLSVYWTRCNNMVTSWLLNSVTANIRNSSLGISAYFTQFKTIHDELQCLTSTPRCICAKCTCIVNAKLDAHEDSIQLTQFLMGLNDSYNGIRGQILLMQPLPTLSQCYSILLQDENQRGISGSSVTTESMAMQVKSRFQGKPFKKNTADTPVYCEYCHITGHVKDKCFCLHGYPVWHKMHGKPKPKPKHLASRTTIAAQSQTQENASNRVSATECAVQNTAQFQFSIGQCKQLIQMLQNSMRATTSQDGSPYSSVNSTQFADTGATDHVTPYKHLLQDIIVCTSQSLHLPNGITAEITHKGSIAPTLMRDLEIGKAANGLYILNSAQLHPLASSVVLSSTSTDLWHARTGHVSPSILRLLPFSCKSSLSHECDSCHFSKQIRNPFPSSDSCSEHVFDLVQVDLWGPYKVKTNGNCTYFLTLVDDKSRATWLFLLSDKSVVHTLLSEFVITINNQFNVIVKSFRSDNGTEFVNHKVQSLFTSYGIIHQTTCTYSPQQNGIVERKHRHLLNVARALRFHASLLISLWGDCVLTACYLINRTPTPVLKGLTPYEVLFHKKPDYSNLRVFGCLCYATVVPQSADKFAPRCVKGVFLGYPYAKKDYKILNLNTKQVCISRDVQFVENQFPFQNIVVSAPSTIFINTSSSFDLDPLTVLDNSNYDQCFSTEESETVPALSGTDDITSNNSLDIDSSSSTQPIVVSQPSVRPHRSRQLPAKFQDFVGLPDTLLPPSKSSHAIANTLSYSQFTPPYNAFLANITKVPEPHTFTKASQSPEWCTAMNIELATLETNKTWAVVPLPPNK